MNFLKLVVIGAGLITVGRFTVTGLNAMAERDGTFWTVVTACVILYTVITLFLDHLGRVYGAYKDGWKAGSDTQKQYHADRYKIPGNYME